MKTECLGGRYITRTIVNEECFSRIETFTFQNMAKELWVRLHHSDLITLIERIEIVADGMARTIEIGTVGP